MYPGKGDGTMEFNQMDVLRREEKITLELRALYEQYGYTPGNQYRSRQAG